MLLPSGLLSIAVLYNADQTYLLIIQGDQCLEVFDYSVVSTAVISDCSVGTFYTFYLGSIVFIVNKSFVALFELLMRSARSNIFITF